MSFTGKTVFLVALATSMRRSELHSLAFSALSFREDGAAVLGFIPGFLAKTQTPASSGRRVVIPSLSRVAPDPPDRYLCPVRALKAYAQRTREPGFRKDRKRLFLSFREGFTRQNLF